jgi:hypothetical protein
VVATGAGDEVEVIERRKITFATGGERNVFHFAAEAPPSEAAALVERVRAATTANAVAELAGLVADLQGTGLSIAAAVVPIGSGKRPERLEEIVRVHALMHAAEGHFYRDVVAAACETVGLRVIRTPEKALPAQIAARLGIDDAALDERLKAMGARLGPPWSQDQKLALLAAWTALPD